MLSRTIALIADYGALIPLFAAATAIWTYRRPRALLLPFAAGALAVFLLDVLAGHAWFEPRPFAAMHSAPCRPYDPADNSFPSDHAALCSYLTGFSCFVDVRWATLAFIGSIAVSVARVACLLHWPHDVAVGWAIGGVPGLVAGYLATHPALKRTSR